MNTTSNALVWIIDDEASIRWVLERALHKAGLTAQTFASAETALSALHETVPDIVVADINMRGMDGLTFLDKIHAECPGLPVIIMTAYSDLGSAVAAYERGAFEYLPKPFDIDEAIAVVNRAAQKKVQSTLATVDNQHVPISDIVGRALAMQTVFKAIGRLAHSTVNVLLNGESGTGKERVARALHQYSPKATKAFIALNMAAIPNDLLESELFGHERGAFTGAHALRQGRFEQANGGTLFLDEIGDMPAPFQTRLLRVLSDGTFYRVGGHSPIQVNVRIIAATHQNLEQRVRDGTFREDLFHRLNVIRIQIPPLRERRTDIPLLMIFFLSRVAIELATPQKTLTSDAMEYLQQLPWPGNVRQLENLCRWLTIMTSGLLIQKSDLPAELLNNNTDALSTADWVTALEKWADLQLDQNHSTPLDAATTAFEGALIKAALKKTRGRRQDAAKLLGWGRNTLTRKLKQYGIE